MCLSARKTKLLIIGSKRLKENYAGWKQIKVIMDEEVMQQAETSKDLGLIMSNDLKWTRQLYGKIEDDKNEAEKGLMKRLNMTIGSMKKIKMYATRE